MDRRRAAGALVALAACVAYSAAAPTASNQTSLDLYEGAEGGCYYNFQHYGEGDRIMTNEPCLNCTCHNRMLMCYLRVCPFTKPIGQDCTVEKRADQCCPIVTCPDVPVDLLTSTSTNSPMEYGATGLGKLDSYGCSINGRYLPEGSKVPPTPNKPCEHCYCIRNMTTCVMQECTLHVDGCTPIYHKDVCCPVRYSCDHPEDEIPLLDDMTTTVRPTPGFLLTTTTLSPVTAISQDCVHDTKIFPDGALIKTEKACEHCYCMKGDIVCVVQECGTPMENEGKNCTSLPPREGQCCPDTYICEGDDLINGITDIPKHVSTDKNSEEAVTVAPPKRVIDEGSGYTAEPEEPYTGMPSFDSGIEGSGEEYIEKPLGTMETMKDVTPQLFDESFETTKDVLDQSITTKYEPHEITTEPDNAHNTIPNELSEDNHSRPSIFETIPSSGEVKVTAPTTVTISNQVYSEESVTSLPDLTTEKSFRKDDQIDISKESSTHKDLDEGIATIQTDIINVTEPSTDHVSSEKTESKPDSIATSENTSYIEETTEPREPAEEIGQEPVQEPFEIPDTIESTEAVPENVDITEAIAINKEDSTTTMYPSRIPGEGDCLYNGVTYRNESDVPSSEKCDLSCRCISSIVRCEPVICSPIPEFMNNCQEVYDSPESCCPTYICQSKETEPPLSESQMSGTESPQKKPVMECSGNDCLNEEKEQSEMPESIKDSSHCDGEHCIKTNLPEKAPCEGESCTKVTSDCHTPECRSDDLSSSTSQPCSQDSGCQTSEDKVEEECADDNCRRKQTVDVENKPSSGCEGTECLFVPVVTDEQHTTPKSVTNELVTEIPNDKYMTDANIDESSILEEEKVTQQVTDRPDQATESSDLPYTSSEPAKVETPELHPDDMTKYSTESYTDVPETETTSKVISQKESNTVPEVDITQQPEIVQSEKATTETNESGLQEDTNTLPWDTAKAKDEYKPYVTTRPEIDEQVTETDQTSLQETSDNLPKDQLISHITTPPENLKTDEPVTEPESIYTHEPYSEKPDIHDVEAKLTEPPSVISTESELFTTNEPEQETSPEFSISHVTQKPSKLPEEIELQEQLKTVSEEYVTKATVNKEPELDSTRIPESQPEINIVSEMTEMPEIHGTQEYQEYTTMQPEKMTPPSEKPKENEELITSLPESMTSEQFKTTESSLIVTEKSGTNPEFGTEKTEHKEEENEIPTILPEHRDTTESYERTTLQNENEVITEVQKDTSVEEHSISSLAEITTETSQSSKDIYSESPEIISPVKTEPEKTFEQPHDKENENEIPTESPEQAATTQSLKSSELEPINEVRGDKEEETTTINVLSSESVTEENVSLQSEHTTSVPDYSTFDYRKDGHILETEMPKHQPQDLETYSPSQPSSQEDSDLLGTTIPIEAKQTTLSPEIKTEIPEYLTSAIPEQGEEHEIATEGITTNLVDTTESLEGSSSVALNQANVHVEEPTLTEIYDGGVPVTILNELSTEISDTDVAVTLPEKAIMSIETSPIPEHTESSLELSTTRPEYIAETTPESIPLITDLEYTQEPMGEANKETHTMEPVEPHITNDIETTPEKHELPSTESVTQKLEPEYAITDDGEALHTEVPQLFTLSDHTITEHEVSENEAETEHNVSSGTEIPVQHDKEQGSKLEHDEQSNLPSLEKQTTPIEETATEVTSKLENVPTKTPQSDTIYPEETSEVNLKDSTITTDQVITTEEPRVGDNEETKHSATEIATTQTSDYEKENIPVIEEMEPSRKSEYYPTSSPSVTEDSVELTKATVADVKEPETQTYPVSIDQEGLTPAKSTALPTLSELTGLSTEIPNLSDRTTVNQDKVNETRHFSVTEEYELSTKPTKPEEEVTFETKVPDESVTLSHDEDSGHESTTKVINIHEISAEEESNSPIPEPQTDVPLSLVTEASETSTIPSKISEQFVPEIKLTTQSSEELDVVPELNKQHDKEAEVVIATTLTPEINDLSSETSYEEKEHTTVTSEISVNTVSDKASLPTENIYKEHEKVTNVPYSQKEEEASTKIPETQEQFTVSHEGISQSPTESSFEIGPPTNTETTDIIHSKVTTMKAPESNTIELQNISTETQTELVSEAIPTKIPEEELEKIPQSELLTTPEETSTTKYSEQPVSETHLTTKEEIPVQSTEQELTDTTPYSVELIEHSQEDKESEKPTESAKPGKEEIESYSTEQGPLLAPDEHIPTVAEELIKETTPQSTSAEEITKVLVEGQTEKSNAAVPQTEYSPKVSTLMPSDFSEQHTTESVILDTEKYDSDVTKAIQFDSLKTTEKPLPTASIEPSIPEEELILVTTKLTTLGPTEVKPTQSPTETLTTFENKPTSLPENMLPDTVTELTEGKPTELPEEKPIIDEKLSETLAEIPEVKPEAKPSEVTEITPTEIPGETLSTPEQTPSESNESQPSELPEEKPVGIPDEKVSESPEEKPVETPSDKLSETPEEKPVEIPGDKLTETPVEIPGDKLSETPEEKPVEIPDEKVTETPDEKVNETPDEKPVEIPDEKVSETPEEKPSDIPQEKPIESPEQKPNETPEDEMGTGGYGQEPDYGEEDQAFGPGTCRYGGKVYVSAQQIPRDDPCDFCFCFRSDIICLQQSCPPPIHGCHEEPIQGFCCPRYECPVSMATTLNVTTTTTTTTTTLPPHFPTHAYKGAAQRKGCLIKGHSYKVGEVVRASSGPCLHCTCGGDGQMKCDPKACTPEPMLRQMIAAAVSSKRRR